MSFKTKQAVQNRMKELGAEIESKTAQLDNGHVSLKAFNAYFDAAKNEYEELDTQLKTHNAALGLRDAGDANGPVGSIQNKGVRWSPPSPMHAGQEQFKGLFEAAKHRAPFRFEIGEKGMSDWGIGYKTAGAPVSESGFGGLPSILMPQLTLGLPYEPDRAFTHFLGADMPGPSIEYLQHTGNTNPAAIVAELGTKPDIGIQLTTHTATATKIAGLASISMEALNDFTHFANFVPSELTRAVIDAETNYVLNGTGGSGSLPGMTGVLNVSGTLARAVADGEAPIDTMVESFNDLRVGSAFAKADLVLTHPTTWTYLKTQKSTTGLYVLAQNNPNSIGDLADIFGVKVITSTRVPVGTAVVFDTSQAVLAWTRQGMTVETNYWGDTEWTTNTVSFRCEERVTIGVQRPTAINIVTGLTAS
jgi:Phage capsid family